MADIVQNLHDGTFTATTSAAALNGGEPLLCVAVLVQNDPSSGQVLRVGNAISQSVGLSAGEQEVIPVNDVSEVFVKTDSGTARINWHAVG